MPSCEYISICVYVRIWYQGVGELGKETTRLGLGRRGARMVVLAGRSPIGRENAGGSQAHLPQKTRWVRLFFVDGPISLSGGGEAGGNWIRQGVVMERRRVRWPTVLLSSATDGGLPLVLARFVRGLSTHQGSGCRRRLRTAATAAKCHRAPVDSHRVADQMPTGPSDEPTTSTARRVAAATWIRVPLWLPGRTRWCPRGGRDGHAAVAEREELTETGLWSTARLIHPLHVVVDVPSRMTLFRATADTQRRISTK